MSEKSMEKSIWQQISNPRETYVDGYGTERKMNEPGYITAGRNAYNAINTFLYGPKEFNGVPINQGSGALEFFFDPAGAVGKIDDVAKLAHNMDNIKDTYRKAMLNIKNRRHKLYHELDMADKGKRVGGMNYAFDLMGEIPGTKAQNKVAAQYNAAKKSGDVEKAASAEKELRKLTRKSFYDPYVDRDSWNMRVKSLIDAPFNGGPRRRFEIPETNYYLQPTQVAPKISADDYLDKFKADELRRYQLRRKVNSTPSAQERIIRNADKYYPEELIQQNPDWADQRDLFVNRRIYGDDDVLMDIYWRRGDLDGVKHPKIDYVHEDLPF